MIASSLRPLMTALQLRSRPRRLNRQQLLRLLAETGRRPGLTRPACCRS
jgi:hypothetical protein